MKSIYKRGRISLSELLACILALWILNPITHNYVSPVYIVAIIILWFIIAYSEDKMTMGMSVCNRSFLIACIYPIVLAIYAIVGHTQFEKSSIGVPIIVVFFMYCYYRRDVTMNRMICRSSIIFIVLMSIYTLTQLHYNPDISRLLASGNRHSNINLISPFTAGYTEVYYMVFLTITIFGIILSDIKIKVKIKYIPMLGLLLLFFLRAQYTIAILLICAGVLLIQLEKNSGSRMVLVSILLFGAIFFVINIDDFSRMIYFLSGLVPKGILKNRIIQIGDLFSRNKPLLGKSNGALVRFDLYLKSWNTFINHFFFGIGDNINTASINLVGGHSTFLDRLAEQGIFGGGIYIITRLYLLKIVSRIISKEWRGIYYINIIIYIIMSILNTTNRNSLLFMLLVIVPLFLESVRGHGRYYRLWDRKY